MTAKTLFRTIRNSLGRFIAISLIVGLGIGFYTGLKSAEPAMKTTAQKYLNEQNQYDLQLISTLGFTEDDLNVFQSMQEIREAETGYSVEAYADDNDHEDEVFLFLSLPQKISIPQLTAGHLPSALNECAVDSKAYSEAEVGKTIQIRDTDNFELTEFIITGLVQSPRYINNDRGTASIGSGNLSGFVYLMPESFSSEVFHEILLKADTDAEYFTEKYEDRIQAVSDKIEPVLQKRADLRYQSICSEMSEALQEAKEEIDSGLAEYDSAVMAGIPEEMLTEAKQQLDDAQAEYEEGLEELSRFDRPSVYIFNNESNIGYLNFKNDIVIIDGISNAFPMFFALIAALICITTMTRMVHEERGQIGTLKALGYSSGAIVLKYILYSSLAGFIGCLLGFFYGTGVLPRIIWAVYGMSYGFAPLEYWFSPVMYVICIAISMLCPALVTWFVCRKDLSETAAGLMRPKAPIAGKTIILERIKPLWTKLSFLNKTMLRNAFRYRQRTALMLVGIAGCTALIVTGFGLKDSVANILEYQYDEIMVYDAEVRFESSENEIEQYLEDNDADGLFAYTCEADIKCGSKTKSGNLIALPDESESAVFHLKSKDLTLTQPRVNEIVLSGKLAALIGASSGETVNVDINGKTYSLFVAGICDNYIGHYAYISLNTLTDPSANVVYVSSDNASELTVGLRKINGVRHVMLTQTERDMTANTMSAMNYVVMVVIVCAGALAFIVLYNLTNINIIERIREVATVQVLGFHTNETNAYVLRENILLSVIGAGLGLAAGRLMHWYVMQQVQVDQMKFDIRIATLSYVISFGITILFTIITNLFMQIKLSRINMAESLKAVE